MESLQHLLQSPSPLEQIRFSRWENAGVNCFFKRDDLIHPHISGNKWRKLKGHLDDFYENQYEQILTFGGAFSNHITATAAACHYLKIPCFGLIRGEIDVENPALSFAASMGMQLVPVSRAEYKEKDSLLYLNQLKSIYGTKTLIIPEGGAGEKAIHSCKAIVDEINIPFHYLICAVGTGTTLAGITASISQKSKTLGIAVLKGKDNISPYVQQYSAGNHFELNWDYHCGAYAKTNELLLTFARNFQHETQIPLDYVYTAKMVFAVDDLIQKGYFEPGATLILLHTGGIANAPI